MSAQPWEARLAHLEGAFLQIDRRLDSFERMVASRFAEVDSRFNQVDSRFNQMESRFTQMESRFSIIDQRFNWLTGIVVASWISTIVAVLFHH
jgi:hypothetical protein